MPQRKGEGLRWLSPAAVFAVALAVRSIYLWQIHDAPFFELRLGDAEAYHQWAKRISAGDWFGREVFYQAPLYPYLLGIIYRVFGDSVMLLRAIQAVLGAAGCTLLAIAGRELFGRNGVLAGVLLALYPPAIFLDGLLEKSSLATFLSAALLALLAAGPERMTPRRWLGAGAVLGLLALTRENALILAVPVLAWIGWAAKNRRLILASLFLAGCLATLLPVGIRNWAVAGEFHLTTSQFGPNFYIGNHAGASGNYEALAVGHGNAADEREDATRLAEQAARRRLNAGEVSGYWSGRALDYIRTQPVDWARLMARKLAATLNAAEASDTESQEVYAERSWLLRILSPFDFGMLLGLAAMGAVLTANAWKRLWPFYAIAGIYAFSVAAFYVFARYRFPLAVVLMLPAAGGIAALKGASRRHLAAAGVAAATALAFAHLPLFDARAARATHYAGIAGAFANQPGEVDVAMSYYQRALDVDPRYPAAQYGMGTMLARSGRNQDAIPYYRSAVAAWPDYEEAHYNLGMALAATGNKAEAAEEFRAALRIRPDDPEAHFSYGKALLESDPESAAAEYGKGLELRPKDTSALVGLGVALTKAGRPKEALAQYRLALAIDPRDAAAHNNLGWTLATEGHVAEAVPYFERALELKPDYVNAHMNLEQAKQMLGRK